MLLQDGMSAEQVGISLEDSQFLESRVFGVQEICRWFHLPPTKLADCSRATYSNSEQSNADYYSSCLRRWLTRIEAEIQSKLVDGDMIFAEHKVDAILRGDIKTRYDSYKAGREAGFLSVSDCRKFENLDPVAGGDTFLVPLNHTTIGGPTQPTRDEQSPLFQSQGQSAALLTGTRDVLIDQLGRFVRRECGRARQAQATGPKLRSFVESFYSDQMTRDLCAQVIKPGVKLWHTLAGLDIDVDQACATLVDRHFADSKRELLRICDLWGDEGFGEALQRRLQDWEENRASRIVDHLIQHGIPPAPTHEPSVSQEPRVRTVSMGKLVLKQMMAK